MPRKETKSKLRQKLTGGAGVSKPFADKPVAAGSNSSKASKPELASTSTSSGTKPSTIVAPAPRAAVTSTVIPVSIPNMDTNTPRRPAAVPRPTPAPRITMSSSSIPASASNSGTDSQLTHQTTYREDGTKKKWKYGHSSLKDSVNTTVTKRAPKPKKTENAEPKKRGRKRSAANSEVFKSLPLFDPGQEDLTAVAKLPDNQSSVTKESPPKRKYSTTASLDNKSGSMAPPTPKKKLTPAAKLPENSSSSVMAEPLLKRKRSSTASLEHGSSSMTTPTKRSKTPTLTIPDKELVQKEVEEPAICVAKPGEIVQWSDFSSESEEDPDSDDEGGVAKPVEQLSVPLLNESLGFKNPRKEFDFYVMSELPQMKKKYGKQVSEERMMEKIRREWAWAPVVERSRCRVLAEESRRECEIHNAEVRAKMGDMKA